ncbi:MAG: N-acetyltransferase, partial [Clostridiales bacterium]|nr:N-acetyltransferase [Clostridiales bacterium]
MRKFRPATEADAGALAAIYAPYVRTPVTFDTEAPTEADFARRIAEIQEIYPYLVAEVDGKIVGYAYAHRFRERAAYQWGAELSIYLVRDYHRRGAGRALYEALLKILKRQGFRMAYGCVTVPNPASVALHEKLGFRSIGAFRGAGWKGGAWHDVMWFERRLGGGTGAPMPIVPIGELDV